MSTYTYEDLRSVVKEMETYIGEVGRVDLSGVLEQWINDYGAGNLLDDNTMRAECRNARYAFGRVDLLVQPLTSTGDPIGEPTWIQSKRFDRTRA